MEEEVVEVEMEEEVEEVEEVGVWIGQEIKVGGKQQRILQSRVPSTDSGGVEGWRGER